MPALFRFLALAAVSAATLARAADVAPANAPNTPPNRSWTFSLQVENDIFANTDDYYTNGVRMSWVSPDLRTYSEAGTVPVLVYKLSNYLPFIHDPAMQRNVVLSIGQNMYTPENIDVKVPDPHDRPYAGWLYFSVAFHNKTERWLDVMELNIGVVGSWSLAGPTQTLVHKTLGIHTPQGWDYQVPNEPAVNLVWERKIRFIRLGDAYGPGADAFVHFGGSLGTLYTYAEGGALARVGWHVPTDFGVSTIRLAGDVSAPVVDDDPRLRATGRWGIALFTGIEGRAVLRDGTLDGPLFSHYDRSVDKYPFVADFTLGASITFHRWKLAYAEVARSKEFHGQTQDWHEFGSVTLSTTY